MLVIDLCLACYGSRVGVIIIDERGVVLELARWNWDSISWARLSGVVWFPGVWGGTEIRGDKRSQHSAPQGPSVLKRS